MEEKAQTPQASYVKVSKRISVLTQQAKNREKKEETGGRGEKNNN